MSSIESQIDALSPQIVGIHSYAASWPQGSHGAIGHGHAYAFDGEIRRFPNQFNNSPLVLGGDPMPYSVETPRNLRSQVSDSDISQRIITTELEVLLSRNADKLIEVTKRGLFGARRAQELRRTTEQTPYRPTIGEIVGDDNPTPASLIGYNFTQWDMYRDAANRPGGNFDFAVITSPARVAELLESLKMDPANGRKFAEHILRSVFGITHENIRTPDYSAVDEAAPYTQYVDSTRSKPHEGIKVRTV
tara:strand:+ start:776 stop:1519 length:744 start_codon:yes stop_codon:yes gene_type:complete